MMVRRVPSCSGGVRINRNEARANSESNVDSDSGQGAPTIQTAVAGSITGAASADTSRDGPPTYASVPRRSTETSPVTVYRSRLLIGLAVQFVTTAALVNGRDRTTSVDTSMTNDSSANESIQIASDEQPADEMAAQRARYLEDNTDLSHREGLVLGYCEQGYDPDTIAWTMGSKTGTVSGDIDRIVAQYGLEAIEPKERAARGDLEPITEQQLEQLSASAFRQWLEHAIRELPRVPEGVNLDHLLEVKQLTTEDGGEATRGDGR